MELLYLESKTLVNALKPTFRRDLLDEIEWTENLIFIQGSRGVGKTTMIIQHIKEKFGDNKAALYVSMDDMLASQYTVYDIAKSHFQLGGTHLFIDEIHKYKNWSIELKNIRDKIQGLKVVVSGSSILNINEGAADLSRRSVTYNLPGLSFREYLNIELKQNFEKISLQNLLQNHSEIALKITEKIRPLGYFQSYLKHGYFPFYLENANTYHQKLNSAVNVILEQDMALLKGIELSKIQKIKKLIYLLSVQVPYQVNILKLATSLEIDRTTLLNYLVALEQASVIFLARNQGKFYTHLTKPDKIYLQNTNLLYLSQADVNKGTLRETFFINQVAQKHSVHLSKTGDFVVDDTFTFEIGGSGKDFNQISAVENSFLALDDIVLGINNKIPLWLFGFLN